MAELRTAPTADLDPAVREAARALLDEAFHGDVTEADWEHALGGVHALVWDGPALIGHGSVIQRRLLHQGRALRAGYVAAFSVPANQLPTQVFHNVHPEGGRDPQDCSEQLVIVGERSPGAHKSNIESIRDDIRAAIAVRHGVSARDVLLVPAGSIPRTSSGKVGHAACRAAYLDGSLRGGHNQDA